MLFNEGYSENSYFRIMQIICEEIYSSSITSDKKRELDFYYDEDLSFNACAYSNGKIDYMNMNVGTLIEIFSYMKTAFSNPSCFCFLGDVTKEKGKNVRAFFEPHKRQLIFSGIPIDDDREHLSTIASLMALRFIYGHELGHLYNGHTEYIRTLYSVPNMQMIVKKELAKINAKQAQSYALDRRTLEMDADAFAASISMVNIIMSYLQREKQKASFVWLKNPIEIFSLWSFSIHSIFLLFEYNAGSKYDKFSYYLPNEARGILVFTSALNVLESYIEHGMFMCNDEVYSEIKCQIANGIVEAEKFFNATYGTNYDFLKHTIENKEYVMYAEEVLKHWNDNLYGKLKKFARVPLYHPDTIEETMIWAKKINSVEKS